VLDPQDKRIFEEMVTHLHTDDPAFVRRTEKLGGPRSTKRVGLAVLLWTLAPICVVFGGWTGLLFALAAIAWGTHLLLTGRTPTLTRTTPKSPRRPGASL
jgi:DUF3040 family protein